MKTNQEFKNAALASLKGRWSPAILATFMLLVFTLAASALNSFGSGVFDYPYHDTNTTLSVSFYLVSFLIVYPLVVGYANVLKHNYYGERVEMVREMIDGTLSHYLRYVVGYFLMYVKVFLWTLLLIIPGIIMRIAYTMTSYILEDRPELSAWEASTESRRMMKGHKFDFFCFYLSFIGWFILCIISCGVGFIWLYPYYYSAKAAFYNEIKAGTVMEVVSE